MLGQQDSILLLAIRCQHKHDEYIAPCQAGRVYHGINVCEAKRSYLGRPWPRAYSRGSTVEVTYHTQTIIHPTLACPSESKRAHFQKLPGKLPARSTPTHRGIPLWSHCLLQIFPNAESFVKRVHFSSGKL